MTFTKLNNFLSIVMVIFTLQKNAFPVKTQQLKNVNYIFFNH